MELSKKNIKKILGIITFGIVLFTLSQNLSSIASFFKGALAVFASTIIGFCLAFILNIPMTVLENKVFKGLKNKKNKFANKMLRPLSLTATVILSIGFIVLLLFIIIPQLHDSISLIIERVPAYYQSFVLWVDDMVLRFGLDISTEILHNPKINIDTITAMAEKLFTFDGTSDILSTTMGVTSSVISGVSNFIIGFIIAVYILAEKEKIGNFSKKFFEKLLPEKINEKLLNVCSVFSDSFSSFITGQVTDAVILAVLCFIGMSIFRFPNAIVISVIIGVTALIPVIGPLVGEFIGCFIIFMESPLKALFFLIFVLILQAIDNNFIYPKIVGKSVGLPGILVLLAVIIGGNFGGILGILLGVPTASAVYALMIAWLNSKSEPVNVPVEITEEIENENEN
ncbi:MAG: AI-2E family transporter [Clostridia bacterium]|nr:AI-2E family transporter [Clostridia bacterium]